LSQPRSPLAYASVGFEVVTPVVLFMFAGYWIDQWLESLPWFLLLGALLGIAVGFYNLFRKLLPRGSETKE
jgi:F0F1-type ATP synthase assembly protein I